MSVGGQAQLPAAVASGQGKQDRMALRRREPHPPIAEHVLHPQAGSRPRQPDGQGPWGARSFIGQGGETGAVDVMPHEGVPVGGGEASEGGAHGLVVFLGQNRCIRELRLAEVGQGRLVAPLPLGAAVLAGDHAPGHDDAVGGQRLGRQPLTRR